MSKFITFEETCALLGIMDFEIFDSLQEGLQIYSRYGYPKPVCLQKVLDKSGIKIREGFRFQIPFSSRLSNH
jgi:hypothetical protein